MAIDKPPAGAALLAVKVTVDTLLIALGNDVGVADTVTVGTVDVTTTEAEPGVPMLYVAAPPPVMVTVAVAVAFVVAGVTAVTVQVLVVVAAAITMGDTQSVVYSALAAGGVIVTDSPPTGAAALDVKV